MSQANETEFNELAAYIAFYATHVWRVSLDSPTHPSRFLETDKFTKSQLLAGLRQAANDTVEDSSQYSLEQVTAFDDACKANQVLTLSEIRRRFSRKFKSILANRRISNDTDYYLVAGVINDMGSSVSNDERRLLEELAVAYEEKAAGKAK
jgi:hypothetical protein